MVTVVLEITPSPGWLDGVESTGEIKEHLCQLNYCHFYNLHAVAITATRGHKFFQRFGLHRETLHWVVIGRRTAFILIETAS